MLSTYIAITIIVVSVVLWTISTYQRLVMLDENIGIRRKIIRARRNVPLDVFSVTTISCGI